VEELLPLIRNASHSGEVLHDMLGWLTLNAIKSEKMQYSHLLVQEAFNVPRRVAFRSMIRNWSESGLSFCQCFQEPLSHGIPCATIASKSALQLLEDRLTSVLTSVPLSPAELAEVELALQLLRGCGPSEVDNLDSELQRETFSTATTLQVVADLDEEKTAEKNT
jgi:hypothetical protein